MSGGSKPSVKSVDARHPEQKIVAGDLQSIIQSRLSSIKAPTGKEIDLSLMGESWSKGVVNPMMRAFSTYVEPKIAQSFRRGSLFSKARGDATARVLSDLQGSLTTELANRNWAATLAKTDLMSKSYYQSPAAVQEALSFLQTPGKEVVGLPGTQGTDWLGAGATAYGSYLGAGLASGGSIKMLIMCIPEGSLISLPNGQKNVEDIKAGDVVLDKDKKETKVLMKYEFDEELAVDGFVEMEFNNNIKIMACNTHTIDGVAVKDLKIGEKGLVSKKIITKRCRSYDLLTTGRDGGYLVNGIGIDSMIPELHKLMEETARREK